VNPHFSKERNSLLVAGVFKQYFIKESESDYSDLYHSINIMVDRKIKSHLFLGLFVGESDKPFYGGLRTFTAGPAYGYEFIRTENISLTLGIGLGVGDFGIELPNGSPLPVMPIPIVRFNVDTSLMDFSFEFLTKPVLNVTLFSEYRLRLINSFRVNQFRDIRDLLFDTRIMYRFFSKESKMGDFAGIGLGIKNGAFGFPLAEKGKSYEVVYHCVYGMIDLSFLQIQSGYSFNGTETYDLKRKKDIGDGFYINVILAWQF
jgi:hypothetical protein